MIVACPTCDLRYDDAYRWTLCPHMPLECSHVPYDPQDPKAGAYCQRCDLIGPHTCIDQIRTGGAPPFRTQVRSSGGRTAGAESSQRQSTGEPQCDDVARTPPQALGVTGRRDAHPFKPLGPGLLDFALWLGAVLALVWAVKDQM